MKEIKVQVIIAVIVMGCLAILKAATEGSYCNCSSSGVSTLCQMTNVTYTGSAGSECNPDGTVCITTTTVSSCRNGVGACNQSTCYMIVVTPTAWCNTTVGEDPNSGWQLYTCTCD